MLLKNELKVPVNVKVALGISFREISHLWV